MASPEEMLFERRKTARQIQDMLGTLKRNIQANIPHKWSKFIHIIIKYVTIDSPINKDYCGKLPSKHDIIYP
jgi:hypothetical protein